MPRQGKEVFQLITKPSFQGERGEVINKCESIKHTNTIKISESCSFENKFLPCSLVPKCLKPLAQFPESLLNTTTCDFD